MSDLKNIIHASDYNYAEYHKIISKTIKSKENSKNYTLAMLPYICIMQNINQ